MHQWSLRALRLSSILVLCQLCVRAYLVNPWTAREWASGFFTNKCHRIPKNMTLCYGIGYDQMRLPNLLNHESVDEAVQQSNIWNLLDKTKCHDDLRVFLCSLYAPVCLKEGRERQIIKPCRSLCRLVRDNCVPRMRMFGYEWPAIARCDKFPDERRNHLCIPPRKQQEPEKRICRACDQAITFENIISSYCMANVVMKGKMKSHRAEQSLYFLNIHKKRRYYRSLGLTNDQKRTIVGQLRRNNGCVCPKLREAGRHDKFLIMGQRDRVSGRLNVVFLTPWQRRNKSFRRAARAMRKRRDLCRRQRQSLISEHLSIDQMRQKEKQRRRIQDARRTIERPALPRARGDTGLLGSLPDRPLPPPIQPLTRPVPDPGVKGSPRTDGTRIGPWTVPRTNQRTTQRANQRGGSSRSTQRSNQRKGQRGQRKGGQRKGQRGSQRGGQRGSQRNSQRGSQRAGQRGSQRGNRRGNQRGNQRGTKRPNQRSGRRRNGRGRKGSARKSGRRRDRGRGSGNKGSSGRDSGSARRRKQKRKRKRKMRRHYLQQYYGLATR